ncbi:hypothetical protein BKA93DRAFT_766007 [Sparassis latifolia]
MVYFPRHARRSSLLSRLNAALLRFKLVNWLRLIWLTTVLWDELGIFHLSLAFCKWPDDDLPQQKETPTHVLLVSEPQVRYIPASKRTLIARLRNFFYELTLQKNWSSVIRLKPDLVVFLGDMINSVRALKTDTDYESQYRRFMDIFRLPPGVSAYYLPGNNDVGLNIDLADSRQARRQFSTHFGPLNQQVLVHNHTFVLIDASGLVEEDYQRAARNTEYDKWTAINGGPVHFVETLREQQVPWPVLFTHIPLYRPDTAACGLLRERGTIRRGVGPGYQNVLGKKTTNFLLQTIQPSIVFSGDDRDYCEYTHVPSLSAIMGDQRPTDIREVTVKSFSPYPTIRRPGFQLLSLISPPALTSLDPSVSTHSLSDTPCLLPNYIGVYTTHYLPLLLMSTVLLACARLHTFRGPALPIILDPLHSPSLSSPGVSPRSSFPNSATMRDVGQQGGLRTPRTPHMNTSAVHGNDDEGSISTFRACLVDDENPSPIDKDYPPYSPHYMIHNGERAQWTGGADTFPGPFRHDRVYRENDPNVASPALPDAPGRDSWRLLVRRQWPWMNFFGRGSTSIIPGPLRRLRWRLLNSGKQCLSTRRRRGITLLGTLMDLWRAMWPPLLLWCVLMWWR